MYASPPTHLGWYRLGTIEPGEGGRCNLPPGCRTGAAATPFRSSFCRSLVSLGKYHPVENWYCPSQTLAASWGSREDGRWTTEYKLRVSLVEV